jgi:hypothetical protein
MSTGAYARHTARETMIWPEFEYSYLFGDYEVLERDIIFGLYSGSYLNGQEYLQKIKSEELANLLTDYNNKISELTTEQTVVVADIASKRYLAGIDKALHDQKMTTAQQKIDMENALADARYAALASDQAALTTMAVKVATETEKTAARITELEAYIEIEGMNLSREELEIAEKELQSLKVDHQNLEVTNEILRIQIQTTKTAKELLDIDVQVSRTEVNIADTERAIAKIGLLANDLEIEQAQTDLAQAEIPVSEARIALAQARNDDAEADLLYIANTLMDREDTIFNQKSDLLNLQKTVKEYALTRSTDEKLLQNKLQIDAAEASKVLTKNNQTSQVRIDAIRVDGITKKAAEAWLNAYAAIEAHRTLINTDIATQLTHMIRKSA